jgi:hypothetical protein
MLSAKSCELGERFCKTDLDDLFDLFGTAKVFRCDDCDGPFVPVKYLLERLVAAVDRPIDKLPIGQFGAHVRARSFIVNAGYQCFVLQGRSAHSV